MGNTLNSNDKTKSELNSNIKTTTNSHILKEKKQTELVNIDSKNILNINFSSKLKEAENDLYDNLLSSATIGENDQKIKKTKVKSEENSKNVNNTSTVEVDITSSENSPKE